MLIDAALGGQRALGFRDSGAAFEIPSARLRPEKTVSTCGHGYPLDEISKGSKINLKIFSGFLRTALLDHW